MPSLNWLGRAQNKNVLKTIFLYGSSLSVLPKVMNHWVNQAGILWFLICLPLISWVACRDLIWDCLPFLYGSMEGQRGWRAMGQSIFLVAAQGHAVPGERLRICAHGSFFAASFSELPSQVFFAWLFPPLPLAYLLTVSIPWGLCVRSLEMNGDGLQPPSKQLQQLEGPCCRWAEWAHAST